VELRGALVIIVALLASLTVAGSHLAMAQKNSANTVHVVPSDYVFSEGSTVWIAEYGRLVVLDIGDNGGFAGITVLPPLGLGGFDRGLGSVADFGFMFRYDVTEASVYLVIDVMAPNGTEYLLRGNATVLPVEKGVLMASNDSVEWCVGTWDGVDPESLEPVVCGLSFNEAVATLPSDSLVKFLGVYYSSPVQAQAVIYALMWFNGEYCYFTLASAYDWANEGSTILVHSGNYSYWELMPPDMREDLTYFTTTNNIVIEGEDRSSTLLINPRITVSYVENITLSSVTVLVNEPLWEPSIMLYGIEGLTVANSTFIVDIGSKLVTAGEDYEALQISSNDAYIANSEFIATIHNVGMEQQREYDTPSIEIKLLQILGSNLTIIDNMSSYTYIGNITLLNNTAFSQVEVIGLLAEGSENILLANSTLILMSDSIFSGNGSLTINTIMAQLENVTEADIWSNVFLANVTPTINLTDTHYEHSCISAYGSKYLTLENNTISLVHEPIKGSVAGISLSEINSTVIKENAIEGIVPLNDMYIADNGIEIVSPIYVNISGKPMFSRDISIVNNSIKGLDVGVYVQARGGVEINGTTTYFPDMVGNVTILYNEIAGNLFGIFITGYNGSVYPGEAHYNSIYGNVEAGLYYGAEENMTPPQYNASLNWWGDVSGPFVPGFNDGEGDIIEGYLEGIVYSPWLSSPPPEGTAVEGATVWVPLQTGSAYYVDAVDEADMEADISVSSDVNVTLSLLRYGENPVYEYPPYEEVKYVDVRVNATDVTALSEVKVRIYYYAEKVGNELALVPYWWNGSSWVMCSDWGINTTDIGEYGGYVWIRIGRNTSPSILDLQGTPIALTEAPQPIPEPPLTAAVISLAALAFTAYIMWRRKAKQ